MGLHLSPKCGHVILFRGYTVFNFIHESGYEKPFNTTGKSAVNSLKLPNLKDFGFSPNLSMSKVEKKYIKKNKEIKTWRGLSYCQRQRQGLED